MITPTDKADTRFLTLTSKIMKITDKADREKKTLHIYGQYGRLFAEHLKAKLINYGQSTTRLVRMFVRRFSAYLCGLEAIRTKPHPLYRSSIVVVYIYYRLVLYREKAVRSVRESNPQFLALCTGFGGGNE
jgi:hypothetical protein